MSAAPYQFFDLSSHKSLTFDALLSGSLVRSGMGACPSFEITRAQQADQTASCTDYHVYSVLGVLLVGVEKLRIFLVSSPSELIRLLCLRRIKI